MALNIGNGNVNNRILNRNSRSDRSSSASSVKGTEVKSGRYTIGDLKPGLEFKASVSDVNQNTIKLRLTDGQEISARIDSTGEFNIGEEINFTVKANDGVQIDITPTKIPTEVNPTLLKALNAADLPVNSNNISMVEFMMNEGMSVDKNSLMGVYRKILSNPQANIESIVQMSKFNIEITPGSVVQFENYKSLENQISKDLMDLTKSLTNDIGELISTKSMVNSQLEIDNAGFFAEEMKNASFVSKSDSNNPETIQTISNSVLSKGFVTFDDLPLTQKTQFEELMSGLNDSEKELILKQQFTNNFDNLASDLDKIKLGDNIESAEYNKNLTEIALKLPGQTDGSLQNNSLSSNVDNDINSNQMVSENGMGNNISNVLSEEELLVFSRELENSGFSKDVVNDVKSGMVDSDRIIQEIYSKLNNDKGTLLQLLDQNILSSKSYQKLLSNEISKQWFIKPEEVAEEQKVSSLYERLNKQIKTLETQVQNLGKEVSQTTQMINNISNNIDFMNQVNHLYNYVQIPLKMSGQDAQSDLYVFTNKKNLNDPDAEIKALLHLDMDALGSVDAFLKLKGTKLDTKFTLENDETYDLFEKHIDRLVQRLEAKGYNCEVQFDHGITEVDFVEDFLKQGQAVGNVTRFSFDVRA